RSLRRRGSWALPPGGMSSSDLLVLRVRATLAEGETNPKPPARGIQAQGRGAAIQGSRMRAARGLRYNAAPRRGIRDHAEATVRPTRQRQGRAPVWRLGK